LAAVVLKIVARKCGKLERAAAGNKRVTFLLGVKLAPENEQLRRQKWKKKKLPECCQI
jgi:hypothetical protein